MATGTGCTDCPVLANPLFRALPEDARERVTCMFRPTEVRAGTPLCLEGFPAHSVFAIRSGTCKEVRYRSSGKEQVFRAYGPGDFMGLDAIVLDSYPYTLATTTQATVCHARAEQFLDLALGNPVLAREILRCLCDSLRQMRDEVSALGVRSAVARVARLLISEAHRHEPDPSDPSHAIALPLNRRDTAAMLGMAEESLSRQLTELERSGAIGRRGRLILIESLNQLEEIATD